MNQIVKVCLLKVALLIVTFAVQKHVLSMNILQMKNVVNKINIVQQMERHV